jgi:putative ABC transport system permease protein
MLRNYFKIALAVLMRRKFFTFISLFGISLTLTVLLVVTSFFDKMFSANYPDFDRNKSLHISKVAITNTKEGWYNGSSASFHLLETIASTLKTPHRISIFTFSSSSDTYINNKKLSLDYKYTDAAFWEVTKFQFAEGKPYSAEDVRTAQKVAVITERTRDSYFGGEHSVTGKYITLDNVNYLVIGVVKGVPEPNRNYHSDVYLPYTASKNDHRRIGKSGLVKISLVDRYMGGFGAVLVAKSEAQLPEMRKELDQMLKRMFKPEEGYDKLYVHADTPLEAFSRSVVGGDDSPNIGKLIGLGSLLLILFMLLPAINLININITRIMERSSEIGVRKAFGATSRTLVYQFLVENLILTVIGGILGTLLSLIVIYLYNNSGMQADINLMLNYRVLGVGILLCLFFGVLSGVYPAWRMSRLNVVHALKSK